MPDWQPFAVYFGIVVFWSIIFFVALVLTRRSMRGVGEPVADTEELNGTAKGATGGASTAPQGSTPSAASGAH